MKNFATKQEICKMFNCSMEQLNKQFKANADTLWQMYNKAIKTGKKVNGYSSEQLKERAEMFENRIKEQ